MQKMNFVSKTIAIDFPPLYCAGRAFLDKANPYDPQAQALACDSLFFDNQLNFLYPPWLLPIISPFSYLSYPAAVLLWQFTLILSLIASGVLLWKLIDEHPIPALPLLFSIVTCVPIYEAFMYGQIAPILSFSIAAFLFATKKSRPALAGVFLLAVLIKPQLFYLALFGIIIWAVRQKALIVVGTLIATVLSLLGLAMLIVPDILLYWLASLPNTSDHAGMIINPTLGDILQLLFTKMGGPFIPVLPIVIPIAAALATLIWFSRNRDSIPNLIYIIPTLICLSLITAPYAYFYDHAVLIVPHVIIFAHIWNNKPGTSNRYLILGVLMVFQLSLLFLRATWLTKQHQFFWVPIGLLIIWMIFLRSRTPKPLSIQSQPIRL